MEVLPNVNYTACATLKVGATLYLRALFRPCGLWVPLLSPPNPEDFLTSLCLPLPARAQTLTMAPKAYAR